MLANLLKGDLKHEPIIRTHPGGALCPPSCVAPPRQATSLPSSGRLARRTNSPARVAQRFLPQFAELEA